MTATTADPAALAAVRDEIRRDVVTMCAGPEGGHLGGSLSCLDALVALYFTDLRIDPAAPDAPDRDIFLLSKGHAALALYAVLARRGFLDPADLAGYARDGSLLAPHANPAVPGVEAATGSLGHGLGLGVGFALARRRSRSASLVRVLLGDGELQEGSCWEAAQVASSLRLDNLTVLIDANGGQQTGHVADISPLEPLGDKWRAFGWHVVEVADGNDVGQVARVLAAHRDPAAPGRPTAVVLRTVKAHGVPLLAGRPQSHFVTLTPRRLQQVERSLAAAAREGGADRAEHT